MRIPLAGFPVPLLDDDFVAMEGQYPSYDAVGRGIYQALRANPGTREVRLITGASGGSANGLLAIMQHCGATPARTAESPLYSRTSGTNLAPLSGYRRWDHRS